MYQLFNKRIAFLLILLFTSVLGFSQDKTMLVTDFYYGNIYGYDGDVINTRIFRNNTEKTDVLKATLDSVAAARFNANIEYYKDSPIYVDWVYQGLEAPYKERLNDVKKEVVKDYYLRIKSLIRPAIDLNKDEEFLLILNYKLLDNRGKKLINSKVALPFQSVRLNEGFQVEDLLQTDEFFDLYNTALKSLLIDEKLEFETQSFNRLPDNSYDDFLSTAKSYVLAQNTNGGKYYFVDGANTKEIKVTAKAKEGGPTELKIKNPMFEDDWDFSFGQESKNIGIGGYSVAMQGAFKGKAKYGKTKYEFTYSAGNWTFKDGNTIYQINTKDEMKNFGINGKVVVKMQKRERINIEEKPRSAYKVYVTEGFEKFLPLITNLSILEDKIIAAIMRQDMGM